MDIDLQSQYLNMNEKKTEWNETCYLFFKLSNFIILLLLFFIFIEIKEFFFYVHKKNLYGSSSSPIFFSDVKDEYFFRYLMPVTMVELVGKAVLPPNIVSVSGWNRVYLFSMWRFGGSSRVCNSSNGKYVLIGVS